MLFRRKGGFIKSLTFLSFCLFSGFLFAQKPTLVIDNNTGLVIGTTGTYSRANTRAIVEASTARMVNSADLTVRSATSGAVSSAKVPATISRTASLAKVAQNIHGKLRFARFTPQGLIGSLILGEILQQLIDNGYTYDQASGNMMSGGQYLVCAFQGGNECIDLNFERFRQPLDSRNIYMTLSDVSPSSLQQVCDRVTKRNMRFNSPSDFAEEVLSSNYISSYGACFVEFRVVKPFTGYKVGDVYTASIRVGTLFVGSRPLTDSDLQRILEPIAAQNPEAVLQAADLSDSDWSAPKVHVLPGTVVNSQPFTDPKDGKAKQARWEFYDCGDNQSCVRETLTDRPDLQPNSPAAPAPDNPPANGSDTAPGTGGQSGSQSGNQTGTDQPPPFDLCKEHPEILACQQMGQPDPGQFDDIRIPVHVDNTTWQEDLFLPSTGVCPAPKTFHVMGKPVSVSYQPLCSFMETIRFIVLICFIVSAAYISFGGLKQG